MASLQTDLGPSVFKRTCFLGGWKSRNLCCHHCGPLAQTDVFGRVFDICTGGGRPSLHPQLPWGWGGGLVCVSPIVK